MLDALCGVCKAEPKKYKCPTCALPYCSIQCFKTHRETHPESASASRPSTSANPVLPQPPPPAPVPRYLKKKIDFTALATSPKFQDLIKGYPSLLPTLQRIYAATIEPDPEDEMRRRKLATAAFRGRGSRGRGRGRGARFGGFGEREGRWTQKKGDAEAMKILKESRSGDVEARDKEAIKAFVDLISGMFGTTTTKEAEV